MREQPRYGPIPDFGEHFLKEVGEGYLFGFTCSSAYHFFKGFRNSPNGGRLAGAAVAVRGNAPRFAGSCAAFWGVWSVCESALLVARGRKEREDPWNAIGAAAAASALLGIRRGARFAARSSIATAAFFALVEGASIVVDNRILVSPPERPWDGDGRDGAASTVGHGSKRPPGFLGIPPGPPIVVEEFPAADLEWHLRSSQTSRSGQRANA